MIYALNDEGKRIKPKSKGLRAICPGCNEIVNSRVGEINRAHWAHKTDDCDSWRESKMSDWHIDWQNEFPEINQEVTMRDSLGNIHRADVRLNNGLVIEIQNSPIKPAEIKQRENFYSIDGGLIWLLNGDELLSNCSLSCLTFPHRYSLNVILIHFNDRGYDEMDYEDFETELKNSRTLKKLRKNPFYEGEFKNIMGHKFNFKKELNFEEIKIYILEDVMYLCDKLGFDYDYVSNKLKFEVEIQHEKTLCSLNVKYWRKFIDEMKCNVFIDNLEGLDNDSLFWLQEEKVVLKSKFLKKYTQHT
jgi:competence protein CoiA